MAEVTSAPRSRSAAPHVHQNHVESFFVLEGELVLAAGDREVRAGAGAWLQVPPGTCHSVAVQGEEAVRFLDLHTPGCAFGTFLRALHDARDDVERGRALAEFDQVSA